MRTSVADAIKEIIDEKALRQGIVATKAGFTPQQFSDMLNGRKVIKAEYIPLIANALGVDPNSIYKRSDNKTA